jgi:putative NADPH-quinone reductase
MSKSKFVIIVSHPDPKGEGVSHRLANSAKDALTKAGHEVKIVDLIKTSFNEGASVKDFVKVNEGKFEYASNQRKENLSAVIKEQQDLLLWCTHLILIGPMWFYRFPASLYAWMERVLTIGFAYDLQKKPNELPLHGKKVLFVITTGGPGEFYSHGAVTSLDAILYPTTKGFELSGMTIFRSQGIFAAGHVPPATLDPVVAKFGQAMVNIDKRPVLQHKRPGAPSDKDDVEVFASLPNVSLDEAIAF